MSEQKKYFFEKHEIAPIAFGYGGCIATDRIVVDGKAVNYMYKEKPTAPLDSGWRFFSGDENTEYMRNNDNHGAYDVNTIANHSPDIIPYLDAEVGARFERDSESSFRQLSIGE